MPSEIKFPIYKIAHQKNINFTGRERELRRLRHDLVYGNVSLPQAISGLGGLGKTQLALQYCYDHKDEYGLIFWLRADAEVSLIEDMLALGRRVGVLKGQMREQQAAVQQVLAWLRDTERPWLLVFDNADMIEPQTLRKYLPTGGRERGHIVITSRNQKLLAFAEVLLLDTFTPDDAVSFLARRSGRKDETGFVELGTKLGFFPLALEHAAAYMEVTGCGAVAYLALYEKQRTALLAEAETPAAYHATIVSTWEVAFAAVRQTKGAAELLNVCAFLAGEGIPLDLLRDGGEVFAGTDLADVLANPLALDKAIGALLRYSLLAREGEVLTMHRTVQTVVRDGMGAERGRTWLQILVQIVGRNQTNTKQMQQWLQIAVNLVANARSFNQYDMKTWEASGNLLPHLMSVCHVSDEVQLETLRVAWLNNAVGVYLKMFGNYAETRPYYERSLAIYEKMLGKEHAKTATCLNNLGILLKAVGDYEGARPYLERALAISEKTLDADHHQIAMGNNNLGMLLQAEGDYEGALPYLERAIMIGEKTLGTDHPSVATRYSNLGMLLKDLGDYNEARPYLERALVIDEKALGAEHPNVATLNNNLGLLLKAEGDYEGARPYLERALIISEKALGADHPQVARGNNNLGLLLKSVGDYEEAYPYLKRALAISERALGADHPSVANRYNNLGVLLKDLGNYEEARPYLERALAIWEVSLGVEHPHTQIGRRNLANLLAEMDENR